MPIVSEADRTKDSGLELPVKGPLSPGLRATGDKAAYEIKFPLQLTQAREVLERAKTQMTLDPYCDPNFGDAYEVHGLYFDTPQFHVFRRVGPHGSNKLRLRRYGKAEHLFLEHKAKVDGRVSKRRTAIRDQDLPLLAATQVPADWSGDWFWQRMRSSRVRPMCEISYLRTAMTGEADGEAFRLTLDRHLRCRPFTGWQLTGANENASPTTEHLILELKFCTAMPSFFKQMIADLQLLPGRMSKYRLSLAACGLAPAANGALRRDDGSDESLSRTA